MEAPLFNDYKKSFILRRLLQTFLGGLQLYFPTSVPYYVYLFQILLFLIVPIIIGIFLYLLNAEALEGYQVSLSGGICIFIYAVATQLISVGLQRQSLRKSEMEDVDTVGDEEIVSFDSIFGPRTWQFLVPSKNSICSIFIHSATAGMVSGFTIYFLDPNYKKELGLGNEVILFLTAIGILSVSIGVWPLFVGCPPEPATFHQLPFELQALSRSSHLLTCIVIHIIACVYPGVMWLLYFNCVAHLVFVCCPLLWLIGALPPIDAYLLWALEQWLVVVLGGSPTASNIKLLIQSFMETCTLFLVSRIQSFSTFAVLLSVRGCFLSLDIDYLLISLRRSGQVHDISTTTYQSPVDKTFNRRKTAIKELIFIAVLLCSVIALSLGVHLSHQDWYSSSTNQTVDRLDIPQIYQPLTILWITLLILAIILISIQIIQKPFSLHFFQNPFFMWITKSKSIGETLPIICQLIRLGGPFVSLLFIHILIVQNASGLRNNDSYIDSVREAIPYGFVLRQIWQFPEQNLVIMIFFYTLQRIFESLENFCPEISFVGKLQVFTLILLRFNGTVKRLQTMFVFTFSSVSEVKQRKLINFFLVGWNITTILLLVAIASFSSVFSIPLFPLFTLPLFLLGFPRPLRFWSYPIGYSANNCSDTIYYEQLAPSIARSVHYAAVSGKLGIVQPGEFFLLRFEDRFFWIQIVECGFLYFTYSFKGLELQETSCHTAEASRVDSIFSRAFDADSGYKGFNKFPLHCLTPLTKVTAIAYSDTRNVLTGVIDSPDTLIVIKDYFFKTLLFFLLNHALNSSEKEDSSLTRSHSIASRIGSADLKTRKVFSSLPKVERTNQSSSVSIYSRSRNSSININDNTAISRRGMNSGPLKSSTNDNASKLKENDHKLNENPLGPNANETGSIRSQSGRGSRIAWVHDSRVNNLDFGKREANSSQDVHESIAEEKHETVLRTMSWEDRDNFEVNNKGIEPNSSSHNVHGWKVNSGHSGPSVSLKAKSYVTSDENIGLSEEDLIHNAAPIDFQDSSTDTETENFYVKNMSNNLSEKKDERGITVVRIKPKPFAVANNKIIKTEFKSILSIAFAPPFSWITDIPYDSELLEELQDSFPLSWFKFLLKHFALLKLQRQKSVETKLEKNRKLIDKFLKDVSVEESYRTLVALCQIILFGSENDLITSIQVLKLFVGDIDSSPGLSWMTDRETLFNIVLKCYRIAVKLSLDHSLVGPTNNSWVELLASLKEYDLDWYVGPDSKPKNNQNNIETIGDKPVSWNDAIRQEVPSLFSIGYNDVKGVFTSHMLTLGEAQINLGKMDGETVRAIWASLSGELLYLTNDDDERYSIQAHPVILRNLTVQAADPPLGYPIYSSPPVRMGLPWLYSQ